MTVKAKELSSSCLCLPVRLTLYLVSVSLPVSASVCPSSCPPFLTQQNNHYAALQGLDLQLPLGWSFWIIYSLFSLHLPFCLGSLHFTPVGLMAYPDNNL